MSRARCALLAPSRMSMSAWDVVRAGSSRAPMTAASTRCALAGCAAWACERTAVTCEHNSGPRMFAYLVVPCSRVQSIHWDGCGVCARLRRSARACGESAWHVCLLSRAAVSSLRPRAARPVRVVRCCTYPLRLCRPLKYIISIQKYIYSGKLLLTFCNWLQPLRL